MSEFAATNGHGSALAAIRALEAALQARSAAGYNGATELDRARTEAEAIMTAAGEAAEARTLQRRQVLLAAADADVERTRRDVEAASAQLRARLEAIEEHALERALTLVLPSPEATTCSPR
jgi:hypothetical protein